MYEAISHIDLVLLNIFTILLSKEFTLSQIVRGHTRKISTVKVFLRTKADDSVGLDSANDTTQAGSVTSDEDP